jgi:hypothetical protein
VCSVTKLVSLFVSMYDAKFLHAPRDEHANATASGFPWATMEELSKAVGFKDLSNQVAGDYCAKQGVTKLFVSVQRGDCGVSLIMPRVDRRGHRGRHARQLRPGHLLDPRRRRRRLACGIWRHWHPRRQLQAV